MGIESAEKAILEASCELTTIMKSNHLDKKKLHLCNSKLSMGVKRKEELVSEKSQLQSKKRKIENNPLQLIVDFMLRQIIYSSLNFDSYYVSHFGHVH